MSYKIVFLPLALDDKRKIVISKYLVFYKVNDKKKTIEIYRILPGSWDIARYLS